MDSSLTVGDYADLDRFNRVVTSKWTKDITAPGTDRDFFNVAVGWDRDSNVTYQDDSVHAGFDAVYSNDDLGRLIVADEGTRSGGSITSRTRKQEWTLTQTGNWSLDKLDLNGDGDWSDTDEWQDGRTHNAVNELTARDLDNNSGTTGNNYSLAYDAAGNLTDDGTDYEYEWDAFYRLRKVKRTDNQALVAEYRYNGLGYRIAEHADTDTDGDVDGSDKWFYFAYDNRWRLVATFRESDSSPKEEFVHQHAGMRGSGSYIDLVAFRDKDANTAWTTASDATLEERLYYCQNWRADVVAIVQCTNPATGAAKQIEQARYSAYGVPFGLPAGDADSDGDCDAADVSTVTGWSGVTYNVLGDIDLDGDVDANDVSAVAGLNGTTLGREVLSGFRSQKGYGGYEFGMDLAAAWHVRARLLCSVLGRWARRDELTYVDGLSMFAYCQDGPLAQVDPAGAASCAASSGGSSPSGQAGGSGQAQSPPVKGRCRSVQLMATEKQSGGLVKPQPDNKKYCWEQCNSKFDSAFSPGTLCGNEPYSGLPSTLGMNCPQGYACHGPATEVIKVVSCEDWWHCDCQTGDKHIDVKYKYKVSVKFTFWIVDPGVCVL